MKVLCFWRKIEIVSPKSRCRILLIVESSIHRRYPRLFLRKRSLRYQFGELFWCWWKKGCWWRMYWILVILRGKSAESAFFEPNLNFLKNDQSFLMKWLDSVQWKSSLNQQKLSNYNFQSAIKGFISIAQEAQISLQWLIWNFWKTPIIDRVYSWSSCIINEQLSYCINMHQNQMTVNFTPKEASFYSKKTIFFSDFQQLFEKAADFKWKFMTLNEWCLDTI